MSADTIDQVLAGQPASFSWHGAAERAAARRRASCATSSRSGRCSTFPRSQPGRAASDAIRKAAADLKLASDYQARVRLTGPVAMADDEFGTLQEGAVINGVATIARRAGHPLARAASAADHRRRVPQSVRRPCGNGGARACDGRRAQPDLDCLCGPVRRPRRRFRHSVRRPLPIRAASSTATLRAALLQHGAKDRRAADARGGCGCGGLPVVFPDRLSAASRSLARSPAIGMLIAYVTSITVLPALLTILNRRASRRTIGYRVAGAGRPVPRASPHPGDRRHRPGRARRDCRCCIYLTFDFNPINLRSPAVESVATFLDLRSDPNLGANAINVLLPASADVAKIAEQAAQNSRGRRGHDGAGLRSRQSGAQACADPGSRPAAAVRRCKHEGTTPPPTDAQIIAALKSTADALNKLAGNASGPGADAAQAAGREPDQSLRRSTRPSAMPPRRHSSCRCGSRSPTCAATCRPSRSR